MAKNFNNFTNRILLRLGESNDSEIVTASLAAFKLIFIPIATMSDKKTSKKQKQYAIKRDFITESVALAGYIAITGAIKNNLTAPICSKYYKEKAKELSKQNKLDINSSDFNFLSNINPKTIKKNTKNIPLSTDEKSHINQLENLAKKFSLQNPKNLYTNTKKTISHICVCALALTIIPLITNKILEIYSKNNPDKENKQKTPESPYKTDIKKPISLTNFAQKVKIGGLNAINY